MTARIIVPNPHVLAQSAVAVSHTGNTNETVLATITIPAGALGLNGSVEIIALGSNNNSGNNKTYRIRFNGIGGTILNGSGAVVSTTLSWRTHRIVQNRNSASSQVYNAAGAEWSNGGGSATAPGTMSVDTTAVVDIVITGQLANGADNIAIESYRVMLAYGA